MLSSEGKFPVQRGGIRASGVVRGFRKNRSGPGGKFPVRRGGIRASGVVHGFRKNRSGPAGGQCPNPVHLMSESTGWNNFLKDRFTGVLEVRQ